MIRTFENLYPEDKKKYDGDRMQSDDVARVGQEAPRGKRAYKKRTPEENK